MLHERPLTSRQRKFLDSELVQNIKAGIDPTHNPDNKPVVFYTGPLNIGEGGGFEFANVFAINHPCLGTEHVRTSAILQKFEDGSFETRNTFYVPVSFDQMKVVIKGIDSEELATGQ